MQMNLQEVIENRQHRYDESIRWQQTDWWKGYMTGWYWAYKDLAEILEQNGFDTTQLVIDFEERHKRELEAIKQRFDENGQLKIQPIIIDVEQTENGLMFNIKRNLDNKEIEEK